MDQYIHTKTYIQICKPDSWRLCSGRRFGLLGIYDFSTGVGAQGRIRTESELWFRGRMYVRMYWKLGVRACVSCFLEAR